MKIVKTKLTENCHFCSREVLLYITWACFVMKYGAFILEKNLVSSVCFSRYRLSKGQPIFNFENLQNFA